MAGNYMGNMTFGVNFDISKGLSQLKEVQQALSKIGTLTMKDIIPSGTFDEKQLKKLQTQAAKISQAMSQSFNTAIGQIDLSNFNKQISKNTMDQFLAGLAKIGPVGYSAFNSLQKSLTQTNEKLKTSSGFADKMLTTFSNTIRWSIATKALQSITGSVQKAYYFTKDLDRSLNDIRIVTSKSADEMERFALQATKAAQSLGKTTTDYTKASLLYYQQGLGDKEVAARTETTLKAANVTGQSTSEVSEQLTAIWNGYKVSAAETEKYIDKVSAVAASTASNLEELSTGMSKVASAANMMGVDIDQLNAQLSTVISVTRQAPETIGAAFKTVYSRMSTIKAGGIDEEDGATLTSYSAKMANFGISVLDANGKLRDMGEVIEEIGNKWSTFSREAQIGLAQAMGGTRQYSNLTALFENWDKYQAALKTSQNAEGKLQEQQDIYMDSISAHFNQLTAEAENLYQTIFDEDTIKDFADGLTDIVKTVNEIIKGFGGIENVINLVGVALVNAFTPKISQGIMTIVNSFTAIKQNKEIATLGLNNTNRAEAYYNQFYNKKDEQIDKMGAGAAQDQAKAQLEQQRQLSQGVTELDKMYYTLYNSLSTEQKNQIVAHKQVLEGLRDEAANIAELEAAYHEKTKRVLKDENVTTENIKDQEKEIDNLKAKLADFNKMIATTTTSTNNLMPHGLRQGEMDAYSNGITPSAEEKKTDFRNSLDTTLVTENITEEMDKNNNQNLRDIIDKFQNFQSNVGTLTTTGIENQLNEIIDGLQTELSNANSSDATKADLQKIINTLTADAHNLSERIAESGGDLVAQKEAISSRIVEGIDKTKTEVNSLSNSFNQEFAQRLPEEVRNKIAEIKSELDTHMENFKDVETMNNTVLTPEEVKIELDNINALRKEWLESLIGASKEFGIELDSLLEQGTQLSKEAQDVKAAIDMENKANVKTQIQRQQMVQGLTKTAASIGQVTMAAKAMYNVFQNIGKQKWTTTFVQFLTLMPMLLGAFGSAKAGIISLATAMVGFKATEEGTTVATVTLSTALKTAFPLILGITAVIAGLIALFSALFSEPEDELANALEEAKKSTEELRQETEKLKNTYDEVISTFDKFNEASKVMDDAKSSTEEYNQALKDANDSIVELINNNADLAQYFERNSKGQLVLKEGYTQEDIKAKANADYQSSQRQLYRAEINQRNLQYEKDIRDSILNSRGTGIKAYKQMYTGSGYGTQLTNISGNLTAENLTKVIKAANGQQMTQEEMTEAFAKALKIDREKGESVELSAALVDQLNNLISKQASIDASNEFQQREMARSFIAEKNYGDYANQSNQVQAVIDKVIGDRYMSGVANDTETYDLMKNAYGSEKSADYFKSELMRVTGEYLAEQGIDYKAGTLKRKGNVIKYEDSEGETQEIDVGKMADRAAAEFMEKKFETYMNVFGDQVTENIEAIDKLNQDLGEKFGVEGLGDAFTAALNGDTDFKFLQELPIETVDKVKDAIEQGRLWDAIPADDWNELGEDAKNTFIKAIQDALDRDYSITVAVNAELHRSAEGMKAFNGLQQEYYEKGSISDDSINAITDWLTSEGMPELAETLSEAVATNKWELISDAINDIKDILDKELPQTREDLKNLGKTAAEEFSQKLHGYNVSQGDSNAGSADWNARMSASMSSRFLGSNSTAEDLTKAIEAYKDAMKTAKSQSLKNSLEQDIQVLEQWRSQLEQAAEDVEYLTDVVKQQENEVFNVVNQANGTKDAMLLIGEGWLVAADDAQTFLENCKNAELYVEQVNADGSLKINEAGITDMATRQFKELKDQIFMVEMELEAAQKEALLYAEGTEQWEEVNQRIERQIELLSILRAALSGLEVSITTAGTDHKSSSGKTKDAIDGLKSILDVYHDIDRVIKEISHDMTVLEKNSKFLAGKKLEKNLKAQLTLLQSQNKALEERAKIAVNEAATLRTQKVNDDGTKGLTAYGAKFDKDSGEILNYFDIIQTKEAELEKARLQFNKSRSDADEKHYNKVKKELDDLKNDISEYEKYLDDRRQMEEQMYDNLLKQLDIKLQHSDMKIQAKIDLVEAKKQILEFQKDFGAWTIDLVLNPRQTTIDAKTTGKASRKVITQGMKSLEGLGNDASELTSIIMALKSADANTQLEWNGEMYDRTAIPKLVEELEKIGTDMENVFNDVKQTVDDARNAYINALQELQDWNQKVLEHYDMKNGMYDHADKLTSLLYGEDSLSSKIVHENIATQKTENLYEQAKTANKIAKESYQDYLKAVESGDEQVAKEAYDIWSENIEKLNDLTESLVESRINQYKMQVERVVEEFDMAVFNGKSMEEFSDQWDLINKKTSQYLDTVNAEFGVEQLRNKYMQAYNKSIGNTKAQEKINKIMNEEIKMLKEKDKLTKYDLDRANAKYDLTLKQIALEEARENKTNLRLRRDSQGNYTYQYTANEEDILKAQGDVDIAQNNLYNMDKDRVNEMTNEILDLYKQFAAEREEILNNPEYINNQELMNQKLEDLQKKYFDKEEGLISRATKEYTVAVGNVQEDVNDILTGDGDKSILSSFNKLKENIPDAVSGLVEGLDPEIQKVINKFIPTEGGNSSIADGVKTCFDDCKDYQDDFITAVNDFKKKLSEDTALKGVIDLYKQASKGVKKFKDRVEKGVDLTKISEITTEINKLAGALYDEGKKNPNLTGHADEAYKKLKELVNPKHYRKDLNTIAKNFDDLTKSVNGTKTSFDNAKKAATDLFNLLDSYSKKKWSYSPTVNIPSATGGTASGDGKSNDDTSGGGGGGGTIPEDTGKPYWHFIRYAGDTGGYYFESKEDAEKYGATHEHLTITETSDKSIKLTGRKELTYVPKGTLNYGAGGGNASSATGWYIDNNKLKTIQLDTGGYTGVWGEEGRLAMLHEKELVLNKVDTENLLKAVDMIRQIDVAAMQSNMMDTYLSALQRTEMGGAFGAEPAQIEQNVTINANFPDAKDRDEIKAAFDSLVNLASQRAMTKRH